MSKWLNNKKRFYKSNEIEKPCHSCGFCPYGQLVEEFPLHREKTSYSCGVFGHECPVYYHAESFVDEEEKDE